MANRNYASGGKIYSMGVKPVILNANITIGAAGAVTSFTGSMIAGVTLVSTGVYTISLQNNFSGLHYAAGAMQSPASGVSGIAQVEIQNAPNATVTSLTNPTLTIKTLSTSDTVAAPASGSVISVLMYFSDSSILIGGE